MSNLSFECGCCGKNEVNRPGEWCIDCQEYQARLDAEWESKWFSDSRLCQRCAYAWGPDPMDTCGAYDMPLYMTKRKYKCKNFKSADIVLMGGEIFG